MGRTITLDVPEPLFLIVSSVADERSRRMFGSVDLGDRIDADLAREYGAGLGKQD